MILPHTEEGCHSPLAGGGPTSHAVLPHELTTLPRWACWRSWSKAGRVTREPVHPATGKALKVSRPDSWATYQEVSARPTGRKPVDGIGLVVTAADGFAVITNAPSELPARLGPNAVYSEPAVVGVGLTVIVRLGVVGAKTGRFVPLFGRPPYQGHPDEGESPNPDGIRTESGQEPYQEDAQSGQEPYQPTGPNPDGRRTVFSSSLQEDYSLGGDGPIRKEVEALAKTIIEQGGGGRCGRWVYALIGALRRDGQTTETVTPHLLLTFAEAVGEDVGAVYRLVVARWATWKPHKVPLEDAFRAVNCDPSLLTELALTLADRTTLLAAGMCKYLGGEGQPFAFPGGRLADVLGLGSQQAGSDVVLTIVRLGLIKKVKDGSYSAKRAAEYVWVMSAGKSVPPPSEEPVHNRIKSSARRPGHSPEQTAEFTFRSRLGGYLTTEHYLAELMAVRRLTRNDKELFNGFWAGPLGPEYARQVTAARSLLKCYSVEAVCKALRSREGASVYSLAAPYLAAIVKAEQVRLDRQTALRSDVGVGADVEATTLSSAPRPHFSTGHSLRSVLTGL